MAAALLLAIPAAAIDGERASAARAPTPVAAARWVQEGSKLTGGQPGDESYGWKLALSGDGRTALVEGSSCCVSNPAPRGGSVAPETVSVLVRSANGWRQQGRLIPTDASDPVVGGFGGGDVALSADGNTALIAGAEDDAAWVFTRSGSTWSQQGPKLTVPPAIGPTGVNATGNTRSFGRPVALSADGNTAIVGGERQVFAGTNPSGQGPPEITNYYPEAWVFTRAGSVWTQGPNIIPSGLTGGIFGVALSGAGKTALFGLAANNRGSALVMSRSGSSWSQSATFTEAGVDHADGLDSASFGSAVALSRDGRVALVGDYGDHGSRGSAWIFTLAASGWAQGQKIEPRDATNTGGCSCFGLALSLSADGSTALVGGYGDAGQIGAAWAFRRKASAGWAQEGPKLTPRDRKGLSAFGQSVAVSSLGDLAMIGGFSDANNKGAVWVFKSLTAPQPKRKP